MKNNKDYANLLEMCANMIKKPNYRLSNEQKKKIMELGETFLENPIDIPRDVMRKKRMKVNSKNALEKSNFELIKGEEINKHALEHSSIKLARSIGKEPGE